MLHRRLAPLAALVAVTSIALASTACAGREEATEEDEQGSGAAAQTVNPTYDAVVRAGRPRVESTSAPTDTLSAETTLLGFVPGANVAEIAAKLVDVGRWSEIREGEERPFTEAKKKRDDRASPKRTVEGEVELAGSVTIDVRLTAEAKEDATQVLVTNTTGYSAFPVGRILEPGKLTIDVKLVPYARGVIVDAKMRVKLAKFESRGTEITRMVEPIFAWLKS